MKRRSLALFGAILLAARQDAAQITQPEAAGSPLFLDAPSASGGTFAYVTNAGSKSVSVIDLATNTVVGSPITVGDRPADIAITPDGTRAYVTNVGSNNVSVIDLATNTVVGSPIPVGFSPFGIAITSPPSPDDQGPVTTAVTADPNPVAVGSIVDLTANVDDTNTGGSNSAAT